MQRVSANAITALKTALSEVFWFKRDLYSYASAAVAGEPTFLAGIDWTGAQYKRDSVGLFVDRLVREQETHQDLLLSLLVDVANMASFPQLARCEEPEKHIARARTAVADLRAVVAPYEALLMERERSRERFDIAAQQAKQRQATSRRLAELMGEYLDVMQMAAQARGYAFERLLSSVSSRPATSILAALSD